MDLSSRATPSAGRWPRITKKWTIPAIGAITPLGLIVVDIAAFIVRHLAAFQFAIAILAFVSGVMLNSWAALNIYRVLREKFPRQRWLQESDQELMLVVGVAIVLVASAVTALFCYQGLGEKELPNSRILVTGVLAIAIPVILKSLFARSDTPP